MGGLSRERHMIEKIMAKNGKVVYEHKAKPVQVYSRPQQRLRKNLMRGVLSSGATTTFKSRLAQD